MGAGTGASLSILCIHRIRLTLTIQRKLWSKCDVKIQCIASMAIHVRHIRDSRSNHLNDQKCSSISHSCIHRPITTHSILSIFCTHFVFPQEEKQEIKYIFATKNRSGRTNRMKPTNKYDKIKPNTWFMYEMATTILADRCSWWRTVFTVYPLQLPAIHHSHAIEVNILLFSQLICWWRLLGRTAE